ncbi:AraC family transcriptional regulator [Myceligenerans indicum]|uniref:AraC family transcriptional regulator n=1 Tax=Myceligenerans indicum TaxID=2593663 RepID=A0ABS1LHT0_9MICO|nr:AraC family transcriptional regulator [Myceligenerans indicum]MBL0885795.1 AraC family transcriptional regulator [Myceligenerans indicum]
MDVLSDQLAQARARGAVFSVLRRTAPWGLGFEGRRPLTVHVLLNGSGRLLQEGAAPIGLRAYDVVLVRGGAPYVIVSEAGAPAEPIADARRRGSDPGSADATVLCGAYTLEGTVGRALLRELPRCVVVPRERQDGDQAAAVGLLAAAAGRDDPGQQAMLDRLLDVNLVSTLRAAWSASDDPAPGWYRALGDGVLRPVLERLHADPSRSWTVEELAGIAGLSRAAFAARFTAAVGRSPFRYLTELRMQRAEDLLVRTDLPLARIATQVGYTNEYAFATAFKRRSGVAPGRWRDEAHVDPDPHPVPDDHEP